MGGKNRQAQRTKNNAKPSNSGRSAEFLSNNMPQFSGFTGMKETGFIFPTLSTEEIEMGIDGNFQLVFKKMNKKDNTTKIKALQEFADLVKNSDSEVVKSVLPCWPRLYNTLVTDSEHKVREATHTAHNEVVQKVKRNLAPYLKSLIAAWFTSQYDTYPPAATAAILSFKNAFPEKKVEEVLAFCNKEILDYIYDNLYIQTTQTVANPKHNTPQELVAKYERVLISSLHGYSLYLKKTPKDKIEESFDLNKKIISNNKFWKYSKHNLRVIRAAWFEVLTSIYEKAPFLLEGEEGHCVSYTLGNIDETDPIVLPLVWQNVLLTMTSVKDWHTKVNIEKLMLPKLWKILKDGGQGNAGVIFPNLLPLLSNMMNIVDTDTFYNNFFQNLILGMKQKSVLASKSESTAVSTSLIECLRYTIMKNVSKISLCEKLIKSFLIPTLHWCLTEDQSSHKVIFNQTASLVQYWSRNGQNDYSNYLGCSNFFWENISSLFEGVLIDLECFNPEKIYFAVEKQIEFFKAMKHLAKTKKTLKVSFDPTNESTEANLTSSSCVQLNQLYMDSLMKTVLQISDTYVKLINDKKLKQLFDYLSELLDEFDSEPFFNHLSEKIGNGEQVGNFVIFEKLLKNWIECDSLGCKSLIHIVFISLKYFEDDEKQIVLDTLNKILSEDCLGWCLEEALSYRYNREPLIQKWLTTEKVTNFFVSIIEKEISDSCPANLSVLFKLAVTENNDEEMMLSDEAIKKILEKLNQCLLHPNNHLSSIDTCASLGAYLSALIYTKNYLLKFTDALLLTLIKLSCDTSIDPDYLSNDTIWEVQTAWQDSLTLLASNMAKIELAATIDKVVSFIHIAMEGENLDEKKLERIIEVLINFCRAIYKATPLEMNCVLSKLFDNDFIIKRRNSISDICKFAEYLNGNLTSCYGYFDIGRDIKVDCQELLQFFTWIYVKVNVLLANVQEPTEDDYDDEDENDQIVYIWSVLDIRTEWISQTLYDLELGKCFVANYATVKYSIRIEELTEKALSLCESHLRNISEDDKMSLRLYLRQQVIKSSWIWTKTVYSVRKGLLGEDPIEIYDELLKDVGADEKLQAVHATQVFAEHLDYDCVTQSYDDVSRIIILRCLSKCPEIDVQIAEVMSTLNEIRNDTVKYSWENFRLDWIPYQIILETCRLFKELIVHQFDTLSSKQVDLIIISLSEWLHRVTLLNSEEKVKPMIIAIAKLYQVIDMKITELRGAENKSTLVKEWDDLFAEMVQKNLVKLWLCLAGYFKETQKSLPVKELPVMYSFTSMASYFDHTVIFKDTKELPQRRPKLLKESCELLTSTSTTLQLAGYKTLLRLITGLVEIDSKAVDTNTPNEDGLVFEMFKGICVSMQDIVSTMLLGLKLGEDSCLIEPFTDSYNYTLAYLLIWDVMLCLCEKASTELKFQYADWLRQEDVVKTLLDNLFRLMPIEIFQNAESKKLQQVEWFSSRVQFNAERVCTSAALEHMVCWIYHLALLQLPAIVRQWWTGTDTRIAQIVERITSAYVSPLLCHSELKDVMQHEKKFKNMTVKVLPTVREIIAIYTVDESQMELVITLPTNYPLVGPDVHCNRQIGGTSHKQWLMQFKKCVLHQNGRIWDGLSLWNNNLDKKFDGVEECYICFAVLHPGTYQLPRLSCQTCKKKFHSACLYKWFSTSNKSSCPICRNLF